MHYNYLEVQNEILDRKIEEKYHFWINICKIFWPCRNPWPLQGVGVFQGYINSNPYPYPNWPHPRPLWVLQPLTITGRGVPLLKPSPSKRERGGVVLLIKKKKSSRRTFYAHRLSPLHMAAIILSQKRRKYSGHTLYTRDLCCQHVAIIVSHWKGGLCGCHVASEKKKQKKQAGVPFTPTVCLVYGLPLSIVVERKREGSVTYRNTGATSAHSTSLPHAPTHTIPPSLAFASAEDCALH